MKKKDKKKRTRNLGKDEEDSLQKNKNKYQSAHRQNVEIVWKSAVNTEVVSIEPRVFAFRLVCAHLDKI